MPDYFTLAEFRQLPLMDNVDKYPDARVEQVAAFVTSRIDREVFGLSGVGFISRPITETLDGSGSGTLLLKTPYATEVTALTVGGTVADFSSLVLTRGTLRYPISGGVWTWGPGNVTVTYDAGYSTTPPADIKEAAMEWTRWRLLATNSNAEMNARQTSQTNDMGTIQYAVAGLDRPSGYPEVDAILLSWKQQVPSLGFA